MKNTAVVILLLLLFGTSSQALADCCPKPDNGQWRREMREFKLKFLAQEMELREDQQKQFFSLYTQMSNEKHNVLEAARQAEERVLHLPNPTENDYRIANEAFAHAREQEVAIEKKYDKQFRTFLSQRQLFLMKEAEKKFREKLHQMRRNRPPRN